jgi:NitT/TauT family transport system permease protein
MTARRRSTISTFAAPVVGIVGFFGLWEALVRILHIEPFKLPGPFRIVGDMAHSPGFLARQAAVTGREALLGLTVAFIGAVIIAVPMARWRFAEHAVQPVATLVQVIPLVCYAPAFVIWLGFGLRPIVAVTALIASVPILFNTVTGLRAADQPTREVLESAGASRLEIFRHLELPTALPYVVAGLRTSVGLALIGAVLGEWSAFVTEGLGVQIKAGIGKGSARLIWSSAFTLGAMGLIALVGLTLIERRLRRGTPDLR